MSFCLHRWRDIANLLPTSAYAEQGEEISAILRAPMKARHRRGDRHQAANTRDLPGSNVRFAPKATEVLHFRETTRRAINGLAMRTC